MIALHQVSNFLSAPLGGFMHECSDGSVPNHPVKTCDHVSTTVRHLLQPIILVVSTCKDGYFMGILDSQEKIPTIVLARECKRYG
jgi:hypothetical protein